MFRPCFIRGCFGFPISNFGFSIWCLSSCSRHQAAFGLSDRFGHSGMGGRSAALVGALGSRSGSARGHGYSLGNESRGAPPILASSDSPSAGPFLFSNDWHVPSALARSGQILASVRAGDSRRCLARVVLVAPSTRLALVGANACAAVGLLPDRALWRLAL